MKIGFITFKLTNLINENWFYNLSIDTNDDLCV